MSDSTEGAVIAALLTRYRFQWADEVGLQDGIAGALEEAGYEPEREVPLLGIGRIDLLVGAVGIEVKVSRPGRRESPERVAAQLQRYALHESIDELVLATSSTQHRRIPDAIAGVPVHVVLIGGLS